MEGQSLISEVTLPTTSGTGIASTTSISSQPKEPPKSWQYFDNTDVIRVQADYVEYFILNKEEEKIYTALLTYDERSCWFSWLCCCQSDFGFIPHESLYPNPPAVNYKRHPLNICGFGVQIYDNDNKDVMRFHRAAYDVKNPAIDEIMKISGPSGGSMGSIVVPRDKGGDWYDIKDADGRVVFEVPTRVTDAEKRHVYEVSKVNKSGEQSPGARITIEGKHELHVSATNIEHIPAGDFHVHYDPTLHPREKALLLAAAFFIRIREFSGYIPMIEAKIAAKAILKDKK